jgi:hypothetical protein
MTQPLRAVTKHDLLEPLLGSYAGVIGIDQEFAPARSLPRILDPKMITVSNLLPVLRHCLIAWDNVSSNETASQPMRQCLNEWDSVSNCLTQWDNVSNSCFMYWKIKTIGENKFIPQVPISRFLSFPGHYSRQPMQRNRLSCVSSVECRPPNIDHDGNSRTRHRNIWIFVNFWVETLSAFHCMEWLQTLPYGRSSLKWQKLSNRKAQEHRRHVRRPTADGNNEGASIIQMNIEI